MKKMFFQNLTLALIITIVSSAAICSGSEGVLPIADAGSSRYAAMEPVVLYGTGSYDPENFNVLTYLWRQISGPSVVITDANTPVPTISSFIQTDEIQECEFELIVSDGELMSLPDTVKVIIVPDFGVSTLLLENESFQPYKPTIIYFGGGDGITGSGLWYDAEWAEKANIIGFSYYRPDPNYTPDDIESPRTYYRCGDMIIAYLSSVAPDYKQPIQTIGHSTGGQPAIDVGIHLNVTYTDARYAVNHITFLDATPYCRDYSESISTFLASPVDGEQCWVECYVTSESFGSIIGLPDFHVSALNVGSEVMNHLLALNWYRASITVSVMNEFNNGVIAGAFWSVVGPGKNLQLAFTPDQETYKFKWYGELAYNPEDFLGYMDFYDEPNHPGRLPEPVTLIGPENGAFVDANGAVLSCEECENAVVYQLLFGSDPYRVVDYHIVSDTPNPPTEVVTEFPFEQTWWTVKVCDQYGSTIYADPICFYTKDDFLLVDDFELYNDVDPPDPASNRIFDAWIDGYATPEVNGATIGNPLPPYSERNIVHSGSQSMPYIYDNNLKTSEATLTLVYPHDCTERDMTNLSLWFKGNWDNSAERMYITLNDTAIVYHDNPSVTRITRWTQWDIDLQTFADQGVDLANVNTITIGFGTKNSPARGGSGKMYYDDIRIYNRAVRL
jgi:hypothetical protein